MERIKIGIIGCGAAGTSLFSQLVEDCINTKNNHKTSIYIFEKSPDIARGLPYNFDYECNLLNRTTDKMSAKHEKPDDFYIWANNNLERIKSLYPNINVSDKQNYLPRSLFGLYLHDIFFQTVSHAKQNNITINIVRDEVINIHEQEKKFNIETTNNNFYMDYSVLTIGHISCKKFKSLVKYKNFYNSPYPTTQIVSTTAKHASIGILGSRLSAVDAAISLTENGHKGKIYFISRNKFLPSIKSSNNGQCIKIIDDVMVKHINDNKQITLKYIMRLITELASYYNGEKSYFYKWLNRPTDPIEFIRHEINEYDLKIRRIWDALFLEGNNIIELIWDKLSKKDKRWFLHNFRSKWLSYRVGIPKSNAEKILKLFETDQLTILRSKSTPVYQEDSGKFLLASTDQNTSVHLDYLINATGSPLKIEDMDSILINNIVNFGLVKAHEFGGIDIDFSTSKVMNKKGKTFDNFYAIGSITSGKYFFTSVLALNVKHAFRISKNIMNNISRSEKMVVNL